MPIHPFKRLLERFCDRRTVLHAHQGSPLCGDLLTAPNPVSPQALQISKVVSYGLKVARECFTRALEPPARSPESEALRCMSQVLGKVRLLQTLMIANADERLLFCWYS